MLCAVCTEETQLKLSLWWLCLSVDLNKNKGGFFYSSASSLLASLPKPTSPSSFPVGQRSHRKIINRATGFPCCATFSSPWLYLEIHEQRWDQMLMLDSEPWLFLDRGWSGGWKERLVTSGSCATQLQSRKVISSTSGGKSRLDINRMAVLFIW